MQYLQIQRTHAIHANTNEHLQIQTNTNLAVGVEKPSQWAIVFQVT